MKKHVSYPKITQFNQVCSTINHIYNYVGLDEHGEQIYDANIEKPTIHFSGTVKIHGTNAGVSYNDIDGVWVQSRKNIITPDKDNAGFAMFHYKNECAFKNLFTKIIEEHNVDTSIYTITIFGEWAGKGIQKSVGVSSLDKAFFIFGVKISKPQDDDFRSYWVHVSHVSSPEDRIYNVNDFKTFSVDIDFNNPKAIQNKLNEMTLEVEAECPVAKYFAVSGIGEGIVWNAYYKDTRLCFKVKGVKHSKSRVKTLSKVDDVKLQAIQDVVHAVTPEWRLEQMLEETFDFMNGGTIDRQKIGDYLRAVIRDVMKEEMHVIAESGLTPKDINSTISTIAKKYFFEKEKEML